MLQGCSLTIKRVSSTEIMLDWPKSLWSAQSNVFLMSALNVFPTFFVLTCSFSWYIILYPSLFWHQNSCPEYFGNKIWNYISQNVVILIIRKDLPNPDLSLRLKWWKLDSMWDLHTMNVQLCVIILIINKLY